MRHYLISLAFILFLPVVACADGSGDPLGYAPPAKAAPEVTRQERCQTHVLGRNTTRLTLMENMAAFEPGTLTFTGRFSGVFRESNSGMPNTFTAPDDNQHRRGAAGEP